MHDKYPKLVDVRNGWPLNIQISMMIHDFMLTKRTCFALAIYLECL